MTGTVFAIVMLAALLHAIWNAMVKGGADKAASMTAVTADTRPSRIEPKWVSW